MWDILEIMCMVWATIRRSHQVIFRVSKMSWMEYNDYSNIHPYLDISWFLFAVLVSHIIEKSSILTLSNAFVRMSVGICPVHMNVGCISFHSMLSHGQNSLRLSCFILPWCSVFLALVWLTDCWYGDLMVHQFWIPFVIEDLHPADLFTSFHSSRVFGFSWG